MAEHRFDEARLIELTMRYLDADLDARETGVLRGLIDGDPEAAERFVELCVHARALAEPLHAANRSDGTDAEPIIESLSYRWPIAAMGIAAAIAVAVGLTIVIASMSDEPAPDPISPAGPATGVVVNADNVRWDTEPRATGDELDTRAFAIASGRLSVQMLGGSEVELIGPASAQLPSRETAYLARGAARFRTLPGFTVSTPGGVRIIDEGTEFGVAVDDDRSIRVETYAGRVRVEPPHADPSPLPVGMAVIVDPLDEQIDRIAFEQDPVIRVNPMQLLNEPISGPIGAAESSWSLNRAVDRKRVADGVRIRPSADYLRMFHPIADARLDRVGDAIRMEFDLAVDRDDITLGDKNTMAFRVGLFNSEDTPAESDDHGYRIDLALGSGSAAPKVTLVHETPGDGLLGGEVFGDRLAGRPVKGLDNGKPHRFVVQLQVTDAGLRATAWFDGRRVLEHTHTVIADAPRFDRFGFGIGRLSGAFTVGHVQITSTQAQR